MLTLIIFCLFTTSSALYEDQAGKFDWRNRFIGRPDFLRLERPSGGASNIRRVFVASKSNVIASVNARSGDLHWRHILEETGTLTDVASCDRYVFTLSEYSGFYLRAWDVALGNIVWEKMISEERQARSFIVCHSDHNNVYALIGDQLMTFDFNTGRDLWKKSLNICKDKSQPCSVDVFSGMERAGDSEPKAKQKPASGIVIFGGTGTALHLSFFSTEGAEIRSANLPAAFLTDTDVRCLWMDAAHAVTCYSGGSDSLNFALIGKDGAFEKVSITALGLSSDALVLSPLSDHSCLLSNGQDLAIVARFLPNAGPSLTRLPHPSSAVAPAQLGDNEYLLSVHRQSDQAFRNIAVRVYRHQAGTWSEDSKMASKLQLAQHHGNVDKIWTILFAKKDGALAYRLLLRCEDYSIHMFQQSGRHLWLREESLSTILSAEMIDLPLSENQAKMEEEFGHGGDILGMFFNRLKTQFSQLKTFVQERLRQHSRTAVSSRPGADSPLAQDSELEAKEEEETSGSLEREEIMTRDEFNLNKIIVVATAAGKLFGLDSRNGRAVWKYWIPAAKPFGEADDQRMPLFLQRTTAHYPLQPQCGVLVRHKLSGRPMIFFFNPITGVPLSNAVSPVETLSYEVLQANILPFVGEDFLRPILLLDKQSKVHIFPPSHRLNFTAHPVFLHTLDKASGRLQGYRVQEDPLFHSLWAAPVWTVNLASREKQQKVVALASRPHNEHVHSVGRILGDRSVLYKYLNPNLVAAAVEHLDVANQKSSITIYLIDVVAGAIVYSTHHSKAGQPLHLVHSENWVVYSYWNQKSRRFEVAVLELYDPNASNSTSDGFSSLDRPLLQPSVLRQAYILPTSVQKMAVSITEKGITSKSILLSMKTGAILEVPKAFFDPRRSLEMTMELQEEGVLPYMPELPLNTEAIINYYNSVLNVRGIHCAPAGLESTSLVFVYGTDLFYTRIAPSKMYDVLKEDFDYFFIGSVTLGMIVASMVTQKLAARKALYRAWQ